MTQLFANNATGSLATSASNSAVTLTLATGQGAKFPSPTGGNHFMLTLVGLDGNGNENAWEIVRVTARSNDVLTVVRGQEGTTAVAWNAGTRVELRATAGTFDTLTDAIEAAAAAPVQSVNGYTGTVVLAKADVGLGNVENKSSATIRSEITSGNVTTALGFTPENPANKGAANGYAPLGADTKIAATYLPSYVDDVLEYANQASFPGTGETGKIYVANDTNKTYRWSGSAYVEISPSPGSTDSVPEGATNLYFTQARARASISATQNVSYNSTTGVITGPDLSGYLPLTGGTLTGQLKTDGHANSVFFINSGTSSGQITHLLANTTPYSAGDGALTGALFGNVNQPTISNSGAGGSSGNSVWGGYFAPQIASSGSSALIGAYGVQGFAERSNAADTSANASNALFGAQFTARHTTALLDTATSGSITAVAGSSIVQAGVATAVAGFSAIGNVGSSSAVTKTVSVTNYYQFLANAVNVGSAANSYGTITNFYGLFLSAPNVAARGTITNRWGIYQADGAAQNYLAGSVNLANALNEAPAITLASSATIDIGSATSNTINVTGTATITSLGTAASGVRRRMVFASSLIVTHHATSLILPGAANISTIAGDIAEFISLGGGNWRCIAYQKNAVGGSSSTTVVGTPVLTGAGSGVIGASYGLSFSATPYLSGATIASFEVTQPDGSKQTITASGNAGSYSWPVVGNANDSKTFSVTATDSLGNVSAAAQKTITLVNVSINAPSVTSPANGATNIGNNPTLSTSSFAVTGGSDTHELTDWEIWTGANRTGTLVWSSLANSSNKITIAVPSNAGLQVNTTYHIAVRHKGVTYGYSSYGSSSFTTAASFVPTVFGEAYQGGFYTGKIVVSGQTYALIVSPKASGEHTSKQWKTTNDTTANTLSFNDGLANSNAMNNANHPAAQFCRSLSIGGYSDWYLPSMAELELCYRNLKPTTDANYTTDNRPSWRSSGYNVPASNGNGQNSYSDPVGSAYTSGSPAQTSAAAFRTGQSEAFNSAYYWASTEFLSAAAWRQSFTNGIEDGNSKTNIYAVRAVRKVLI